jgi:lysophospholipase L1-like esterase
MGSEEQNFFLTGTYATRFFNMKKAKLIFLFICIIIGIVVSIRFTGTMKAVLRDFMVQKYNSDRDEFNRIFFKKGYWMTPQEKYLQGSGLQKIFTYPIYFKPSLHDSSVRRISFDLEISPMAGNALMKEIGDDYLALLFNAGKNGSHGFRISPVKYIQSGWIELHNDSVRLIRPVNYTIDSNKKKKITMSLTPGSLTLSIDDNAFALNGDYQAGGVGFLLGSANINIQNLEIQYNGATYTDLSPYNPSVNPLIILLIFLLPLASWLCYSYLMARFFKFDSLKSILSDFPVIFLFLFFNVNPHKTFFYAVPMVFVLMFCVRSIIFSKFLYHIKDVRDIRKKGFAALSGLTIVLFAAIYLAAVANAVALQPGETYLEKKEISLPVFVLFFLLSNYLFMYHDRFHQLVRLGAVSATIVIFTLVPKYYNPNSYFATADKLFKPNAMYFHYNGMAKTKPMDKVIPGKKRIFFAGGSATYGFPMDVNDKAFPEQFEELMNKKGLKVDVFNIGMLGHTASSLRYSIEKNNLFDAYPMDMLILYLGYNDATIYPKLYGFMDKTDWQSILFINSSSLPRRIFRIIQFSPPVSYLLLAKSMFIPAAGFKERGASSSIPRVTVEEEFEQVRWFYDECSRKKIRLIIVPELFNRIRSLKAALSRNPQQGAIVAAARRLGVPVIDCYPQFDSVNNYLMFDFVHLNYNGNKKLAGILAEKLRPYLN